MNEAERRFFFFFCTRFAAADNEGKSQGLGLDGTLLLVLGTW
jgi:hypothetical protein